VSFTIESLTLRTAAGAELPLQLVQPEVVGARMHGQKLIAWGRVPPGDYAGFSIKIASAGIQGDEERSRLLVPQEPLKVDLELEVRERTSVVSWLSLEPGRLVRGEVEFSPSFGALLAPQTPPQVGLYCTNTAGASVTAVDRRSRLVTGVIPVGQAPAGIVLDRLATRAYVALSREDQIEILDVAANRSIGRIRLTPGDEPTELVFGPGGVLLVLNQRSRTVSFVDPVGLNELARLPVGDAPSSLTLDRSGQRAFVANRGSSTLTVIDVANRTVAATLETDPEPIWIQVSRDNSLLYVVHRGSGYLAVFGLPSLALQTREYVAMGASTMRIDPRSNLIYLARGDERRVSVYDPVAYQPVDQLDTPGAVSYMTIDDAENTLLALMPERSAIAVFDLTSRRLLAEVPVGVDPYRFTFVGERF
jgi:YVTN family beta-propeller protein